MKKILKIKGMHCTSCAKMIEMELEDKVNKIQASYEKANAEIDFNENKITEKEIKQIITGLGYKVT